MSDTIEPQVNKELLHVLWPLMNQPSAWERTLATLAKRWSGGFCTNPPCG